VKDLFDPIVVEETKRRILTLRSESERQWGSMEVAQTLAHCTAGIEMAMGSLAVKRAPFPANVMGPLIKPLVLRGDTPMRRNSPSSPELFRAGSTEFDFDGERSRLIAAIDGFVRQGPGGCTRIPHPFFGRLKAQEWAILMYKHVDHHLRQFGA
jgi:hypothetical protein